MALSSERRGLRARKAALTRSRSSDDPELLSVDRDLAAARLEDYINRTVDAAPPLTAEQRERLAAILRGGPEPPGSAWTSANGITGTRTKAEIRRELADSKGGATDAA